MDFLDCVNIGHNNYWYNTLNDVKTTERMEILLKKLSTVK